jgi:hypothetical protein
MSLPSDPADLRTPTAEYEAGLSKPLLYAALALALTVIAILLASIPLLFSNPAWIVLAVLCCSLPGCCFAAVGVFWCLDAIRSIGTRVMVFRDGLAVRRLWSSQFYPWDKMVVIWNSGNHAHVGGKARSPCSYRIVMNDGRHLALHHISGLGKLGQTIEEETSRRLLPAALEQYNQGKTICFGRLSVNNQGVVKGTSTLPWGELTSCCFDSDGWLTFGWKDKPWRMWMVVSPNKVVNLLVLLQLLGKVEMDCPGLCRMRYRMR